MPEPEPELGGTGGSAPSASTSGGGGEGGSSAGSSTGGAGAETAGGSDSGGAASGGGSNGGAAPVVRSDGCGQAGQNVGSAGSPLMVSGHQYYVKLPDGYDPETAYPVMFMFNPTNNPISWAEDSAGFEQTAASENWIRVYPHPANSNAGWGAGDVDFFEPLHTEITSNFCVDEARVFASGESSGGDFSSILGCEYAHLVRGIGPCATKPVGGYSLDAGQRECTGQVAAVIIHGIRDSVVGTDNGPATRDFYKELNHCGDETVPVEGYTDELSNCVAYQGCDEGYPVIWCQHNDPNYGDTNHGWPAFAKDLLTEFLSTL
jgi:polyhydroxybutyrate depolymerase